MVRNRFLTASSVLLLCVMLHQDSIGAGTIANSISAKAAGRGGANLAFSDSAALLHDNPAGFIGAFAGDRGLDSELIIDASFGAIFPNLSYSDPQNADVDSSNDPFGLGYISLGKKVSDRLAIGIGAFAPAGFAATWN